jgi:hypothetical protein
VSVADRTEARYVATFDRHYEASTRPYVGTRIDWRHLTLTLRYGPSFTVLPLESKDRQLLIFHNAYLAADYRWQRTLLEVSQSSSFGAQNFLALALTDPRLNTITPTNTPTPTPGATPPTGTGTGAATGTTPTPGAGATPGNTAAPAGQLHASNAANQTIHYGTSTTTVALQNTPSATTTLRGELSYLISGATRAQDATLYPLVRGPRALGSAQYALSHKDAVTTTVSVQYVSASGVGTSAWLTNATESWAHKWDHNTSSQFGVGISGSRSPAANGFIAYSIFPTFLASITNGSELARGRFQASFSASSAPAIDLVSAAVDPRVSLLALVGWHRDAFSATISGDSTFSLAAQSELGALSVVGAGAGVSYQLGKAASVDTGARIAYQKFQGQVILPFSQTVFVGLNFGLDQRL